MDILGIPNIHTHVIRNIIILFYGLEDENDNNNSIEYTNFKVFLLKHDIKLISIHSLSAPTPTWRS